MLMRDEISERANDQALIAALTNTRVALIADETNICSHAAQTAFVTAAMLMARSGHRVSLFSPNVMLLGHQPPAQNGHMLEQLSFSGKDLIPGVSFSANPTAAQFDLAIALGKSPICVRARRRIQINAEPWIGMICPEDHSQPWNTQVWPFGAMAAGALAAGEAFKVSMRTLLPFAFDPDRTAEAFADTNKIAVPLAPAGTPYANDLGNIDFISGGAITNSVLYALARIPAVAAYGGSSSQRPPT